MKLGPVTKPDIRNTATSKNLTITLCRQIVTSFQFMDNLQPPGGRIPDAWSIKHTFSLITSFYLTKTENWTKKSLTLLPYYCFE